MRAPNVFVIFVREKKFQEFQLCQTLTFFFRLLPMRRSWRYKKIFAFILFEFKVNRSIYSKPYIPILLTVQKKKKKKKKKSV